ncbi:hypothetical protein HanOQP8_Chr15g0582071 [Helianthus annuus]|nr:hypothetical protein HanLR1_Chr15g0585121 [Helianthus annuus]KAJ0653312.1 hypothetical protein HanOQP8_Chr15g0582071 [Helianthus annuus]
MTTRAKTGSKRKKPSDPEEDSFQIECQFHDFVTVRFLRLKALHDKSLADVEEKLVDLCSIASAKDKKIAQVEKEKSGLDDQLMYAEIGIHEAQMNAIEDVKVYAARTVLQARIKIAQEAMDPAFDRSAWDIAGWKQALLNLGGYGDVDQVMAMEAGPSGVKDQKEAGEEGAAEGGVAEVGNEG